MFKIIMCLCMIEFEFISKMYFLFCFVVVVVFHLVHLKTAFFLSYGMLSFNIYVEGK